MGKSVINYILGKNKCEECPAIFAHGTQIKKSQDEKYLGEIFSSGKKGNKINIEKRKQKGLGIISEIMSLLEEVPLGRYKIKAGLELKKAWLLNGILYNSEALYSTEQTDIESLEKIDES